MNHRSFNRAVHSFARDVGVIGGGGRVGLPLALSFADLGLDTVIYDTSHPTVEAIRNGIMPFSELGGPELLARALAGGKLSVDDSPEKISECRFLVLVVGTPIDEHQNPGYTGIERAVDQCVKYLRDGQILILRSGVFPGITRHVQQYLSDRGLDVRVAFCPERETRGSAAGVLAQYPQLVGAFDPWTLDQVKWLFGRLGCEFLEMAPMEAELCKLMTSAWRYLQFATVNQFYIIATQHGLDFDRILHGCRHKNGRLSEVPGPGFAAGPCLVNDTMQLAAFSQNQFVLGHAAILINEGLPAHVVALAKQKTDLSRKTAGVLGMAFRADSDDRRDSLSYKLRKILTLEARRVLCTDPYVCDPSLEPLEKVLAEADVLFLAAPHSAYRDLSVPAGKILIDVWDCMRPATAAAIPLSDAA